jgi:hypothetical protein
MDADVEDDRKIFQDDAAGQESAAVEADPEEIMEFNAGEGRIWLVKAGVFPTLTRMLTTPLQPPGAQVPYGTLGKGHGPRHTPRNNARLQWGQQDLPPPPPRAPAWRQLDTPSQLQCSRPHDRICPRCRQRRRREPGRRF